MPTYTYVPSRIENSCPSPTVADLADALRVAEESGTVPLALLRQAVAACVPAVKPRERRPGGKRSPPAPANIRYLRKRIALAKANLTRLEREAEKDVAEGFVVGNSETVNYFSQSLVTLEAALLVALRNYAESSVQPLSVPN